MKPNKKGPPADETGGPQTKSIHVDYSTFCRTIPQELADKNRWVCWIGKKLPVMPNGNPASSTNPSTWSTLADCLAAVHRYSGIGFVLGDGIAGIDLDACIDPINDCVMPWADAVLSRFSMTYAEVSPSGIGVKLFVRYDDDWKVGNKLEIDSPAIWGKSPAIEVYARSRYFCVTGDPASYSTQVVHCGDGMAWLRDLFERAKPTIRQPRRDYPTDVDAVERARRYVAKCDPAVSGSSGHNTTYKVASRLVGMFGLRDDDALEVLTEYNQRCVPPWSERELLHKLSSARKGVQHG